jgi:hypothetical protein
MDSTKARTLGGNAAPGNPTAPLKPKNVLSGPPAYILDVRVIDLVTGWSTERQAYVSALPLGVLDVPPLL